MKNINLSYFNDNLLALMLELNSTVFMETSWKSLRLRDMLTLCYFWLSFLIFGYLSWPSALLSLTGPLGLTAPDWALLGLTGPYWALLGLTGPYFALLGLTGPYFALLGLTGPY